MVKATVSTTVGLFLNLSGNPVYSHADPVQRPVGMFTDRSVLSFTFITLLVLIFAICEMWNGVQVCI